MIGALLPDRVAHAESFGDVDAALFPQEAQVVARAVDKRRREFATARWCGAGGGGRAWGSAGVGGPGGRRGP